VLKFTPSQDFRHRWQSSNLGRCSHKVALSLKEKAPMNLLHYFPDSTISDAPTLILDPEPELETSASGFPITTNFGQVTTTIQPEEKLLAADKPAT